MACSPAGSTSLRAQGVTAFRRAANRKLEQRVLAKGIAVVDIFIAAGDRQHSKQQHLIKPMGNLSGIAPVAEALRQDRRQSEAALNLKFRLIAGDEMGNILQENHFSRARRGHNKAALSLPEGRHDIDDPGGKVLLRGIGQYLVRLLSGSWKLIVFTFTSAKYRSPSLGLRIWLSTCQESLCSGGRGSEILVNGSIEHNNPVAKFLAKARH